jgi:hypothetical protein
MKTKKNLTNDEGIGNPERSRIRKLRDLMSTSDHQRIAFEKEPGSWIHQFQNQLEQIMGEFVMLDGGSGTSYLLFRDWLTVIEEFQKKEQCPIPGTLFLMLESAYRQLLCAMIETYLPEGTTTKEL